jgi:hypothetical protein
MTRRIAHPLFVVARSMACVTGEILNLDPNERGIILDYRIPQFAPRYDRVRGRVRLGARSQLEATT